MTDGIIQKCSGKAAPVEVCVEAVEAKSVDEDVEQIVNNNMKIPTSNIIILDVQQIDDSVKHIRAMSDFAIRRSQSSPSLFNPLDLECCPSDILNPSVEQPSTPQSSAPALKQPSEPPLELQPMQLSTDSTIEVPDRGVQSLAHRKRRKRKALIAKAKKMAR